MMTWVKALAVVVIAALALYGGLMLSQGASNLYADWRFVRALRVQAIQRAQQPKPAAQTVTP